MAMGSPDRVYKEYQVHTLSQEKLVLMLYDGALRFCQEAISALGRRDYAQANESLIKAQDILSELMAGVNRDLGEVAENLYQIYSFIYRYLVRANIKKSQAMVEEATDLLKQIREAWVEAMGRHRTRDYSTRPGARSWQG